ncbi:protein-disulfide reductase DsbD domain-containing protein [endosymbiont of Riftia pachyptila]|nr:protein-disulfide reductase DsbD domain-containing protein [endosymbiont of Riftia pachyptila]
MSDNKQLLELAIQIPEGWHINAHHPLGESLIPTELRLANNQHEWHMAPVTYPSPVQQKLAFQHDPLLVYEGNIQLQATLEHKRTPGNGGATLLDLELQLQACSDEVCLPPETIQLQPIMR